MPETDTIIDALECYRLKCHGEIRCENKECAYNCGSYEGHDIPYCAYNKLLFNAIQKLRAQEEQIEKLHGASISFGTRLRRRPRSMSKKYIERDAVMEAVLRVANAPTTTRRESAVLRGYGRDPQRPAGHRGGAGQARQVDSARDGRWNPFGI